MTSERARSQGGSRPDGIALQPSAGILDAEHRLITIGMFSLVFLAAFESMAVTAIMPAISADLDGDHLYALAFAGSLGMGVVGMGVAGIWADRVGPTRPLVVSVGLFSLGVLIAGLAPTMELLIAGRLVHGLGGGGLTVALYVVVARRYTGSLHPQIFASFAAAWVVPSLVGPAIAGMAAETVGWRWVFLGVIALVVPALLAIRPALVGTGTGEPVSVPADRRRADRRSILWSVLLAAGVLALNLSSQLSGPLLVLIAVVSVVVVVVALRPLFPAGAMLARRGLPSIVVTKGLVSGAYLCTEVYLPYLFTREYGLTPALAGIALTAGGVSWAAASWSQSRLGERMSHPTGIRVGTALLLVAIGLSLTTTIAGLPVWVAIAGWALAGAGMGTAYPRISTLALSLTSRERQGFTSSALAIAESTGAAIALAGTAIVFAAFTDPGGAPLPFAGVFAFAAVVAVLAIAVGRRVRNPEEPVGTGRS